MNLVKWNPSNEMNNWLDDFFNRSLSDIVGAEVTLTKPSVNIIEETDKFLVELAAPGLTKKDFNISLDKDNLIISTEIEEIKEESTEEGMTHRREFKYGSFKRSFILPETVNQESIKANYQEGILTVSLGKKEEAVDKGPQKIEIV